MASSRFQITNSPPASPGSCRCCGGGNKAPYIDLGYVEDWHGSVYYCHECISEMAGVMGYVDPKQIAVKDQIIERMQHQIDDLQLLVTQNLATNETLEKALHAKLQSKLDIDYNISPVVANDQLVFDSSVMEKVSNESTGVSPVESELVIESAGITEQIDDKNLVGVRPIRPITTNSGSKSNSASRI